MLGSASMYRDRAESTQNSRTPLTGSCSPTRPATLPRTAGWASGRYQRRMDSDAVLDGLRREGLHDLARGLRLHNTNLAEHLALAGLRRWLRPGLDPAKAGQHEDTRLRHLLGRQLRQAVDRLRAHRLLQLPM